MIDTSMDPYPDIDYKWAGRIFSDDAHLMDAFDGCWAHLMLTREDTPLAAHWHVPDVLIITKPMTRRFNTPPWISGRPVYLWEWD